MHDSFPSGSKIAQETNSSEQLHQWCNEHCLPHHEHSQHSHLQQNARPSPLLVWSVGLSFVTVVGLCAVVGILVMRVLTKKYYNRFITFFVSAFDLAQEHSHGGFGEEHTHDNHDYLNKSFAAIIGIYLFFFSDKIIKIVVESRKRPQKDSAELHQARHRHGNTKKDHAENGQPTNGKDLKVDQSNENLLRTNEGKDKRFDVDHSIKQQTHALCIHDHDVKEGDSVIATVAWMIILGDGLHNFIDGVTIGASFSESLLSGISVSVAVLCEEFPHELGDVAILLDSGMTMRQALFYNLLSALTCYIGFIIGGCMMPEMKNAMEKALNVSRKSGLEVLALQTSGLLTGLACMYLMARYGENIEF
uniref:Zinc transporter ZIP10 n=1 Tax=Meloidogyne javanica TaxID=6303 RepID=A0A915LPW2_MELJA